MDLFWKASGIVLVGVILVLILSAQAKELGILLTIAICTVICIGAMELLNPVIDFLYELKQETFLTDSLLRTLMKIVGIGLVSEIISLICADAGCSALGKGLHILSSILILYLSIPLVRTLLSLIQDILGGL